MGCYFFFFGWLSLAMGVFLWIVFRNNVPWNSYYCWLAAMGITTFLIYGLDKFLAILPLRSAIRVPEYILHGLALLGGCFGGWAGMVFWGHKNNHHEHEDIWNVLFLSSVGHGMIMVALYYVARYF